MTFMLLSVVCAFRQSRVDTAHPPICLDSNSSSILGHVVSEIVLFVSRIYDTEWSIVQLLFTVNLFFIPL